MSDAHSRRAGRVLRGQALADAIQNFSAVRQLVANGQPVEVCPDGDEKNPFNENSDHPAEAGWSSDSLPDELGRLNPPEDWRKEGKVPDLVINGVTQRDSKGLSIRNFRFLPRYLSSDLPGKKIETYFHKDSRIRYDDLWARMPSCTPPLTRAIKNHRYNNKRIREVRAPFHIPCFTTRRTTITRTDVEIAATLTREMVRQATVWPVTPQGIQDPSNPTRFLPLNSFLESSAQFDMGSNRTWKSIYLLSVLNAVAKVRNAPGDYSTLSRKHLPKSWSDRLSGRRAAIQEESADSNDDDQQENSNHHTTSQEQSAPELLANKNSTEVGRKGSIEEGTSSHDQAAEIPQSSPMGGTGVTLQPGQPQAGSRGSRGNLNNDAPITTSNRTRFHSRNTNSYHDPVTRSRQLSSQALLPSELFEQAARLRQDRNSQIRRPRISPAAPRNLDHRAPGVGAQIRGASTSNPLQVFARGQILQDNGARHASGSARQNGHSWAYGDREQLQPPSHGLPGLHECDENVDFLRYAPVDLDALDDSNPFRIY